MAQRKKPVTEEEARIKMADLCAKAEYCEFEISQKLYRLGIPADARSRILKFLSRHSFIDSFRFARSFARDKCRFAGWGPFKIRQALTAKRIENSTISEALDEVEQAEWDNALERATVSKAKSLDLIGEQGKDARIKLARFLLSRGFGYEDVKEAVRNAAISQKENRDDSLK